MSRPVVKAGQEIDFRIVGQIVSAAGLLHVFPSETALAGFLVPMLHGVPGCSSVRLCFRKLERPMGDASGVACLPCAQGLDPRPESGTYACGLVETDEVRSYPLETASGFYGHLLLGVEPESAYGNYDPLIRNLGNALAILLENRAQRAALQAANEGLEQRVAARTAELRESLTAAERARRTMIDALEDRQRTELALRMSEERGKFALEGAGDGLWDWDVPTGAVFFSKRWKEMLGYTESEIGSGVDEWSKRVHPEDRPSTMAAVKAHLDGNSAVYVSEHRVRCKDGSWKWILDRGLVVSRDAEGKPLRVLGTHSDITERVAQQQKLQELLTQTEQDARTKGELLREVNHRVTNNLVAVLGLMSFEKSHARGDPQSIMAALARLDQRIRGLLHVHRMLSQSAWAPVPVHELAEQLIHAALQAAPWRKAAVVAIKPGAEKVSPRQAGALAMVINELATNTVKHTNPAGGAVTIGFEAESDPEGMTLCYRDNGPGYPPDVLALERSNIGLKLIKELVKGTLSGQVAIANDHGAVTTLRIALEEETRT